MELFTVLSVPAIICFVIGIALLIFEMFNPGFGVAGIGGIILLIAAVVLQSRSILEGLILFLAVALLIAIFAIIFYRSATKGSLKDSDMVLKNEIDSEATLPYALKVGDEGKTITPLRPAGSVMFGEIRADVLTQGNFINSGKRVIVAQIEGNKIIVDEIKK